jgi:hypothetical protein
MRSQLGYCVVWYMVMNVLHAYAVSVFTGSWKMKAVYAGQNLGTQQSDYTGDQNFES